ncbi:uncharacterized protein LOC115924191 [Strongylocentrotus purpuratus]|uniref:Inhibitor I9 domain-containing protein n=1 Tax=Strongylocentrotus purpuratus TaxID=7668 RepID=A0A7M7P061_STRPU|nr:uncharacterized protein LOC115924191 [Strongylocentrotus purpuratus]
MIRQILILVLLGFTVEARPKWEKLFQKSDNDRVPGQYIVALKPGFKADAFVTKVETQNSPSFANCSFFHVYKSIINGFAAKLTTKGLEELLSLEEVSLVEENGVVRAHQAYPGSWGLERVDQRFLPLDGRADFTGDGSGVNAYILDTGIYPSNSYFNARATVGYDAVGDGQVWSRDKSLVGDVVARLGEDSFVKHLADKSSDSVKMSLILKL